jgi:hypothetical protein
LKLFKQIVWNYVLKTKMEKPTSAYLKRKFIGFPRVLAGILENYQTAEGIVITQLYVHTAGLIL